MDHDAATVALTQAPPAAATDESAASSSENVRQEEDGAAVDSKTDNSTSKKVFSIRSLRSPPYYSKHDGSTSHYCTSLMYKQCKT